jgi:hypothetical protein
MRVFSMYQTDVSGIARDRHKRMPVALSLTRDVLGFGLEWVSVSRSSVDFFSSRPVVSVQLPLSRVD